MTLVQPVSGAVIALAFLCAPAFGQTMDDAGHMHRTTLHATFWINNGHYKSPTGEHCCGPNDCQRVDAEAVSITPRGYELVGGELVPFAEAQTSEDGEYWRCKRYDGSRRCFFAPQPSS
jgi:hypothetical protein